MAFQTARLNDLAGQPLRHALLDVTASRRHRHRAGGGPPAQVLLRVANTIAAAAGDRVLVVPGTVLVMGNTSDAIDALADDGVTGVTEKRPSRRGRPAALDVGEDQDIASAVSILQAAGFQASAEHAAAYSGRSKGGGTAENVDSDPPSPRAPGDPVADSPLVVVIDTGIDRAAIGRAGAMNRTDGWLEDVGFDGDSDNIDRLDTENYHGDPGVDGCLDLAAGHGTFVAGVVRRHAPAANITVLRALDTDGHGSETAVADAIERAGELFDDAGGVLNLSLGIETIDGQPPLDVKAAIDALPDSVCVVAAAGNGATEIPTYPAALDTVLGVASVRWDNGTATGSSWSNRGAWVNFSAPGDGVASTFVDGIETRGTGHADDPFDPDPDQFNGPNAYALWTGTSFSAAKVTGALAEGLRAQPGTSCVQVLRRLPGSGTQVVPGFGIPLRL